MFGKKQKQPHPRIALIGFRGVGKSSVAKKMLGIWETKLMSLDSYIKEKHGRSIADIVDTKGWNFFREEERIALKEICDSEKSPLLLDLGGGIVEGKDLSRNLENIELLKNQFFTIYLFISKEKILDRLRHLHQGKHRPSLEENLDSVYDRREAWYQEAASAIIDLTDTAGTEGFRRVIRNL